MKVNDKITIYISGPMTGLKNFNYDAFCTAAKELRIKYKNVINPAELTKNPNDDWHIHLRRDITELVKCDAIYMLSGWQQSKGAKLEHHIATELGMKVFHKNTSSLG